MVKNFRPSFGGLESSRPTDLYHCCAVKWWSAVITTAVNCCLSNTCVWLIFSGRNIFRLVTAAAATAGSRMICSTNDGLVLIIRLSSIALQDDTVWCVSYIASKPTSSDKCHLVSTQCSQWQIVHCWPPALLGFQ